VGRARTPRLVFEWIELTLTCHGYAKQLQGVKNHHVTGVLPDYLGKPSVSHRTFIQITTQACRCGRLDRAQPLRQAHERVLGMDQIA